jgi:hypothetical protein
MLATCCSTRVGVRSHPSLYQNRIALWGQKPRTKYDSNLGKTKSLKHSDIGIIFAT